LRNLLLRTNVLQ